MATPKPKPDVVLDEEDYVDLKRTEINLRLRMERRRELNELYKDVQQKKKQNRVLSAKPQLVQEITPAQFDWDA